MLARPWSTLVCTVSGTTEADDENEVSRPFTILALDGGGVRGLFSAAVLARLEADHGVRVVDHFDLIVGTSTGGIIALGLGAGMAPAEIVELYVNGKDTIFPPARRRLYRKPAALFRAKYHPDGLAAAVTDAFGDKLMCDSTVPLVVPSFDLGQSAERRLGVVGARGQVDTPRSVPHRRRSSFACSNSVSEITPASCARLIAIIRMAGCCCSGGASAGMPAASPLIPPSIA